MKGENLRPLSSALCLNSTKITSADYTWLSFLTVGIHSLLSHEDNEDRKLRQNYILY